MTPSLLDPAPPVSPRLRRGFAPPAASSRPARGIAMKRIFLHAMLILLALLTLVPFIYMGLAALKDNDGNASNLFLPTDPHQFLGIAWNHFTLDNYKNLFRKENLHAQYINSFFYASMTSLAATLACAMGGYALAVYNFKGRALVTNILLAAFIVPAAMLLAPAYQLLHHMSLLDTFTGLILPAIAPPFGIYLFHRAISTGVPREMLEAARIDGCHEIRIFFTIALPLVRPMISAFLMITFLACWNDFIRPQVIRPAPANVTLAVAVAQLKDIYSQDYGMLMAGTMISVLPVMALFLLLQKEFIAGLTSGAVKG